MPVRRDANRVAISLDWEKVIITLRYNGNLARALCPCGWGNGLTHNGKEVDGKPFWTNSYEARVAGDRHRDTH